MIVLKLKEAKLHPIGTEPEATRQMTREDRGGDTSQDPDFKDVYLSDRIVHVFEP